MTDDFLDKDAWAKEVSANFEKYITRWKDDVLVGNLEMKDIENATQKIMKYLTKEAKRDILKDILQKYKK